MVHINGKFVDDQAASLSITNRSFLYGDGVFETLKAVNGKILFWEDHYFRLMASMRIMRMEIPMAFTPEYLENVILDLLDANDLLKSPAKIRLTVYRDADGAYTPQRNDVGYTAFAKTHENPFYIISDSPYEVDLYKDHYLNADLLSTIKSTSKALHVLGSIYAKENLLDNCLLVNTNKMVAEALQGNLFLVKGNVIKTPPLADGCLRGIVRKQLIAIIKLMKEEFVFEEASISPFELQKADELFITNTIIGIQPITKYRKKTFTSTVAKTLLQKLNVKVRLT